MVCPYQVDLGEHPSTMEQSMRDRVAVRDSNPVECSIVATRTPVASCLLRHHMEWGCPVTRRGSNDAKLKHVVKFLTGNLEFLRCESTCPSCD